MERAAGVAMVMALLASMGTAAADELDGLGFSQAMGRNGALAAYVARNGWPDVAQERRLLAAPPWDRREVALYYLDERRLVTFARALILGAPTIHLERLRRPLTDAEIARLALRPPLVPLDGESSAVETRAERAAVRAEHAAVRAESPVDAAERAAARTAAIVSRLEAITRRR